MREFLKGLDLDSETIDTIMAEHGKHLTGLKEQVDTLKQENADYKAKIDESNKSLENLQSLTNENNDLKAELQMSDSNVKKEFSKFVISEVKSKVNNDTDFATALENYKKENPQYFGGENSKIVVQSSPTLNGGNPQPKTTSDIMNNIIRGAGSEE